MALSLNSDGVYLSSFNKELKILNYKKSNFDIIGSAHNLKEILNKMKQGCSSILFSKLFLVDYDKKSPYLGVLKFNNISKISNRLIALGGIKNAPQIKFTGTLECGLGEGSSWGPHPNGAQTGMARNQRFA